MVSVWGSLCVLYYLRYWRRCGHVIRGKRCISQGLSCRCLIYSPIRRSSSQSSKPPECNLRVLHGGLELSITVVFLFSVNWRLCFSARGVISRLATQMPRDLLWLLRKLKRSRVLERTRMEPLKSGDGVMCWCYSSNSTGGNT